MLLALFQTACASNTIVHGSPSQHVHATLSKMVGDQQLPGAQYVALTADQTLVDLQVGMADARTGRAMARDTQQMAYSITKVVTAIAVMQLVERRVLDLERPLSDVYADHPYGRSVTIRRLLAHTAGVPNPLPLSWFAIEGEPLERDAQLHRALVASPRLSAAAGARYGYTNLGYWLLEKAVEAASGEDYAHYVQRHIFEPLGVASSAASFELPPAQVAAVGHSRRMTPMNLVLWLMTPSRYWASAARGFSRAARLVPHGRAYGGLYCSAEVLARILQDLLQPTPQLLSPRARDQMLEQQRTLDGKGTSATLGWVVGQLEGVRYLGKQGGGMGFHGNVRVYPSLGLATVLLANRTEITPGPIDARSDALDLGFVRTLQSRAATAPGGT